MCDEELPILLGNSSDAFLKWRSGEPSLLPPSSFLLFSLYFTQLFPHFSAFSVTLFQPPLTLCSLSTPFSFPSFSLLSLCLCCCLTSPLCSFSPSFSSSSRSALSPALLLAAFLSLFFLIRVTHHCCTDCANITTQRDITDNNKMFPKILSYTEVLLLRSPINWPACGCSVSAVFVIFFGYEFICDRTTAFAFKHGSSQFRDQKKWFLLCCSAITPPVDISKL